MIDANHGIPPSWQTYDTSCWIQDVKTRVYATFGQPNWLAAYAITLIPLGSLLASGKLSDDLHFRIPNWQKWFYLITTIALFLSLIFTKSRSGFLGLGVGFAFGGAALAVRYLMQKRASHPVEAPSTKLTGSFKNGLIIAQIILLILAVAIFGTPYTPTISDLLIKHSAAPATTVIPTDPAINRLDEGGTDSGEIRRIVWAGAIKVWERYPIFGSGVETFAYSYYRDRPMQHNLVSEWDFLYNKAHNEFLNYLATTGLVGLLSYLLFLGAAVFVPLFPENILAWLYKKRLSSLDVSTLTSQEQNTLFIFGVCLSAGIVALSVSNFFGFSTVVVSALLFLFPGVWIVLSNKKDEPTKTREPFSMNQIIFLCLLLFVSLALVFHVYGMWNADYIFAQGKQNSEANQVNVGLPLLEEAVTIAPDEPYYIEELAVTDARIAAAFADSNSATEAAQFEQRSVALTEQMLQMNPVNLNFYKSSARIYSLLAVFDEQKYIGKALDTLHKASTLAPTDPKLVYNTGILELNTGHTAQGLKDLERSAQMKPNYIQARLSLGNEYLRAGQLEAAKAEYEYILKNIQANDPTSTDRLKFIATASAQPVIKK